MQEALEHEPLRDVTARVVAELVRQDHLHLVGRELAEQRVAHEDPTGAPEADHGGVGGPPLAGEVRDDDRRGPHSHAGGQREDPFAEERIVERRQLVEERNQPARHRRRQEDEPRGEHAARPEPPPVRAPPEQSVDDLDGAETQPASDQERFRAIAEPATEALRQEARAPGEEEARHDSPGET